MTTIEQLRSWMFAYRYSSLSMRYNSQTLLFKETPPVTTFLQKSFNVPEQFYKNGYAVLSNIQTADDAVEILQKTIAGLDSTRVPLVSRFIDRLQLAKADVIPVCTDIVASSYQVLHFDMGQPFIAKEPQAMYFVTALYAPLDGLTRTAKTRILPLKGLFSDARWGGIEGLKKRIGRYVEQYGDGWADVNTYRLACFARFLDAAAETTELAKEKDRTVGHWFHDEHTYDLEESWRNEQDFYKRRGIDLAELEMQVQLQPGQMLFFDNTRVVHGRIGARKERELYQFLLGVETVDQNGITYFIDHLMSLLTSPAES